MPQLIILYLIAAYFLGWWPLDETERAIENSSFNVYFYYPDGKEEYIGYVNGLPSCRSTARSYAYKNLVSSSDWSYICCRAKDNHSCASKHR